VPTFEPKTFSFTVDLPGLIDLMGTALYRQPSAAIRELIQNAHDGIVRRRMLELTSQDRWQEKIRFFQDPQAGTLVIEDNRIGLNAEEAENISVHWESELPVCYAVPLANTANTVPTI
jgi:HSP90 family molecular chaperone